MIFFFLFLLRNVNSNWKRLSDGHTTYPCWRKIRKKNLEKAKIVWNKKEKIKAKTHLIEALNRRHRFVIVHSHVNWLRWQGKLDEIRRLLRLSGTEQHGLAFSSKKNRVDAQQEEKFPFIQSINQSISLWIEYWHLESINQSAKGIHTNCLLTINQSINQSDECAEQRQKLTW